MPGTDKDTSACSRLLWPNEQVELVIRQGRFRPGGSLFTPTSFVGTSHRLIIIVRTRMGLRKDFEIVDYDHVTGVKVEHGFISSSIYVRIAGLTSHTVATEDARDEGVIDGVPTKEAERFLGYLNGKLHIEHMERNAPAAETQ